MVTEAFDESSFREAEQMEAGGWVENGAVLGSLPDSPPAAMAPCTSVTSHATPCHSHCSLCLQSSLPRARGQHMSACVRCVNKDREAIMDGTSSMETRRGESRHRIGATEEKGFSSQRLEGMRVACGC